MLYRLLIPLMIPIIYIFLGVVSTFLLRLRNLFKSKNEESPNIYVTFDDGIDSKYTPMLLDKLKEHGVRATFFVMASTMEGNGKIIKRMKDEGHVIGYHSYEHKNQILQSPQKIKDDFIRSREIFRKNGIHSNFYRPPWGHMNPYGMYLSKVHKQKVILWNVIVQDWRSDTTEEILCGKLSRKVKGGSVICLHDGRGKNHAPVKTINALDRMIPRWKEEGFKFETIDVMDKIHIG